MQPVPDPRLSAYADGLPTLLSTDFEYSSQADYIQWRDIFQTSI